MMDTVQYMIEELSLSGEVGVGKCNISTLYRYARQINERLKHDHYDWCVKANVKEMSIIVI